MSLPKEVEARLKEYSASRWSQDFEDGGRDMAEWLLERVCSVSGDPASDDLLPYGEPITRAEFLAQKETK